MRVMSGYVLLHGDCLEQMKHIGDGEIDAIVTDPPYELGFMGKSWDATGIANDVSMWREVLRVLKPGGHVVAFSGSRTYHRMACAIEDAGFEIRDSLQWIYGTGFPKSLDVSKAIDKAAGAVREVTGTRVGGSSGSSGGTLNMNNRDVKNGSARTERSVPVTIAATDAARQWSGWGTALKPAHEPIVLARKPLIGTVASNVLRWGTGALNIDGCRITHASADDLATSLAKNPGRGDEKVTSDVYGANRPQQRVNVEGRWPANVLLDEESARLLDEQSGFQKDGVAVQRNGGGQKIGGTVAYQGSNGLTRADAGYGGGGASRFFYTAKASKSEREAGLEHLPRKAGSERANHHPTVKPISLMRYLVRLITPPGGVVLDPFTGSGTTGIAAIQEGFDFLGIEKEAEYVEIARARIEHAASRT